MSFTFCLRCWVRMDGWGERDDRADYSLNNLVNRRARNSMAHNSILIGGNEDCFISRE